MDTTVAQLIADATKQAEAHRDHPEGQHTGASREFALAITALEDAQMRFTRGIAKLTGQFAPADLQQT